MRDWLEQPHTSEEKIREGAEMLLSFNRNKILYNQILRNPMRPAYVKKLEYELNKYLQPRLAGLTQYQVRQLDERVVPDATEIVATGTIEGDDEETATVKLKGRREDHDSLPQHIRDLFDGNKSRYKKIAQLHATLRTMEKCEPCERYGFLVQLDELDKEYRENMRKYDEFKAEPATENEKIEDPAKNPEETTAEPSEDSSEETAEEPKKDNAEEPKKEDSGNVAVERTWITRNLPKLKKLHAKAHPSEEEQGSLLEQQEHEDFVREFNIHIKAVMELGGNFSDKRVKELEALGCTIK